jgi:signal transduction histidine kinase
MAAERELRMRVLSLETLLDLSQNLNLFVDVEGLANFFLLSLMGQFSLTRTALFLEKRVTTGRLVPVAARGIERERLEPLALSWGAGLGKTLRSASHRIEMREAALESAPEARTLVELGFRSAVPLAVKGRPFGLVLLGERVSQEPVSEIEDQTLASMARVAAIALENLLLYESIRRSNEELKEKNLRLEEMDRLKSEFLSNAGHELKTPLTCIMSYAEFLRDLPAADGRRREFSSNILTQGERLLELIEELLDLGTLSGSGLSVRPVEVDLPKLLAAEAARFRKAAEEKGLALEVTAVADVGATWLDQKQTSKIVRCLLDNAVKFTPPGGTVTVACRKSGDERLVQVRDTGIGIAPEHLALIFERFRQVDGSTTRPYNGLGIGLALAKELAELQGGRIAVRSEIGKGSEFTVHLPSRVPAPAGVA